MEQYQRSHDCGTLRKEHIGQSVRLSGWVNRRRDHGGLIFVDLRDRFGITQVVFDPQVNAQAHQSADKLRSEWVVSVSGKVIPRSEGMANPNMLTGDIEIEVNTIEVLSQASTPPFSICDDVIETNEELRLKYRYLDMRRGRLANNLALRHRVMMTVRQFLDQNNFLEIMTPILGKSTPEGARDYLVPSRVMPGHFYALPQSPQIFKQILMIAGMDRYFQIAPCFRDEDLRSNRQPEFTQIDMELSFENTKTLFTIIEELMGKIFRDCAQIEIPKQFKTMSYEECIEGYGTDKPDLRFGMELINITEIAQQCSFDVFLQQIEKGAIAKAICVEGGASISRKEIDEYTKFVQKLGAQGLAWMKVKDHGLTSNIVKFFSDTQQKALIEKIQAKNGDLIFIVVEHKKTVHLVLDHLRRHIAKKRNLIDKDRYEFLWVTDFPLFQWDAQEKKIASEHHPFTAPKTQDIPLLDSDPLKVQSLSYDLVLNGYELASGSQRIHKQQIQEKIFSILELSPELIESRFGFFNKALQFGTPPHLGIGIGLERLLMIILQTENIRDVIAFPKTQKASDLMMEAPSSVDSSQLKELQLSLKDAKLSWI